MSSDAPLAMSIQGIGKTYSIATVSDRRPDLFVDVLRRRVRHPLARTPRHDFHALQDVTADIHQGEAVGVIGRNGAGKSTLLKILSRVTEPSAGRVELYGRVGSLLEVGTGFHPELTGRENIFLNGSILGMKRAQITRAFDSIVDFAQIDEFLDTPVKRYSSGMYVRLAFAVAAHLDPEILVVDEVLAVGDAEFQRRCLGKMNEVASQEGRTVLFVSHNMSAVAFFCRRVLFLEEGRVVFDGDTAEGIERYLTRSGDVVDDHSGVFDLADRPRPAGVARPAITRVEIRTEDGTLSNRIPMGSGLSVTVEVDGLRVPRQFVAVSLTTETDLCLVQVNTNMKPLEVFDRNAAQTSVTLTIPHLPLNPGRYWLELRVSEGGVLGVKSLIDKIERAAPIEVVPADVFGTGFQPQSGRWRALCIVNPSWEVRDGTGVVAATAPVTGPTPEPRRAAEGG
jgi:lipopolysaccharide transport system ATP-binding protein